jgi:glycosyltransferase involved in cell wall biosynthesis
VIYICIPARDEAPTVGILLWRIRQVMVEFRRDFHVLLLDDGSTDDTAAVAAPYAHVMPLTVLAERVPLGYRGALERLLREAAALSTHPRRDAAVVVQADFTEPVDEIPALVRRLEGGADVVGSTAQGADGELSRGLRWTRRGLPWLLRGTALPAGAGDPFSGFRAYRLQAVRRALAAAGDALLVAEGWSANAEILLRLAPHARRAEEVPIRLRYTRRDRPSRFRSWPAVREAWALVRRAPRGSIAAPAAEPGGDTEDSAAARAPRARGGGRRKRGRREVDAPDPTAS